MPRRRGVAVRDSERHPAGGRKLSQEEDGPRGRAHLGQGQEPRHPRGGRARARLPGLDRRRHRGHRAGIATRARGPLPGPLGGARHGRRLRARGDLRPPGALRAVRTGGARSRRPRPRPRAGRHPEPARELGRRRAVRRARRRGGAGGGTARAGRGHRALRGAGRGRPTARGPLHGARDRRRLPGPIRGPDHGGRASDAPHDDQGDRMRFVMFYHSLVSDWNHGNAHFLRGVCGELIARGHDVSVYEPAAGWSRSKLLADQGPEPLAAFARAYPRLAGVGRTYDDPDALDLDAVLAGADVVIVHEWSPPGLVARIGAPRAERGRYRLLFHDTHHRAVTAPEALAAFDLSGYDGVLAFGACIRDLYLQRGWAKRAWVWHEAADPTVFRPLPGPPQGDLVWIGNCGDDERTSELREFLIEPVRKLGLRAV